MKRNPSPAVPQQALHLRHAYADIKEAHSLLMAYHETLEQLHALGESCPAEEEAARGLVLRAGDLALKLQDALPRHEQA